MNKLRPVYLINTDLSCGVIHYCETHSYLFDLNDKDPSDMGFEKFTNLIQNTLPLTFSNLLEKKLQL